MTTEDELEGFYVVKSIVRQAVGASRVFMRDTQSYCGVLLDDNNRKPICRLFFNNTSRKYLGLVDENKKVTRKPLSDVNDIYRYADELLATIRRYEGESPTKPEEGPSDEMLVAS